MKKDTKSIIEFYMLANKLKYLTKHNEDLSVANKLYNNIILAYAINSEFNITDNIGNLIRDILIHTISKYNSSNNKILLKNIKSENLLIEKISILEETLHNILNKYIINFKEKDIISIYNNIKKDDHLKYLNKYINYNSLRFYILNTFLNTKVRSGWDKNHWDVKSSRIEKVSEHVIGTLGLAIGISEYYDFDINLDDVLEILAIHEIGEIFIGDITPFDGISEQEKKQQEHNAMKQVLGNLVIRNHALKLLCDFDDKRTIDARFAYLCDKLEADIQAKVYQDKGFQKSLDDQENNVVFKNERIQEFLRNGANTVFDMFYLFDKSKYKDDPIFKKTLEYVKNNSLN